MDRDGAAGDAQTGSLYTDRWGGPPPRLWRLCTMVRYLHLPSRRACYSGDEGYQYDLRVVSNIKPDLFRSGEEIQLALEEEWYRWRLGGAWPGTWPRQSRWIPATLVYVEVIPLELRQPD